MIYRFQLIKASGYKTFELEGTEEFCSEMQSFWDKCKYYEGSSYAGIISYDASFKERLGQLISELKKVNIKVLRIQSFFNRIPGGTKFAVVTYNDRLPENKTINIYTNLYHLRCIEKGINYNDAFHRSFMMHEGYAMGAYEAYYYDSWQEGQVKVGEQDPEKRICRFCGKSKPKVSFSKDAHAIPEAIGNTKFFCREECNGCNSSLSIIENNLSYFMEYRRAIYGIPTKKGEIPEVEGRNFVIRRDSEGNPCVHIDASKLGLEKDQLDKEKQTVRLYNSQVVTNEGIYKALVKCVIDLLPTKEIQYFRNTISWINGILSDDSLPSIYIAYDNSIIYRQPECKIFINSQGYSYSPYCTALLYTCDMVYMFVIPFVTVDKGLFKYDEDLKTHWQNFFTYFPYKWKPWDLSDDSFAHPHYDVQIGKLERSDLDLLADDVFKSKRIPEHKKERELVDFPEPDNKDIQSIRIREPKLTMNTGIHVTEEMKRDVSVNIDNPRIILDRMNSSCAVVVDLDIKDTTNTIDYMQCSYVAEIILKDFDKNIELTDSTLAFDYRLRDILWKASCYVGECFFHPQRRGTQYESFHLTDLVNCKNFVRQMTYIILDTDHKICRSIHDRDIHND